MEEFALAVVASRPALPPLLPMGFHSTDLAGLQRLCVDYFPGSMARPRLMSSISMVVTLINRVSIPSRLWVAGSFLTETPEPVDCSLTLVLVDSVFHGLAEEQREFFDWYRDVPLFEKYRCYNYGIVLDAERADYDAMSAFWLRQYGFHDQQRKAGVAELLLPQVSGA
ncbi:MAG: hypothetical protein KDK07_23350 [Bauldia sp.]|nr:hypothetical protein [Bauldia sp.]